MDNVSNNPGYYPKFLSLKKLMAERQFFLELT